MSVPERPHSHLPAQGRRLPVTTYRLQLQPRFTFDDATAALDYLENLGVTDLYLSPILQAAPGSTHGYDVVDHTRVSAELGGRAGFERLARAAHARGMGVIVDVVPNHMAVPTPLYHNRALWSVLRDGPASPYAAWFDGSDSPDGILMPVLGARIGRVLADQQLRIARMVLPDDDVPTAVLTYFDHVFPLRPGTEHLPMTRVIQSQYYRLAYWKVADEELNYRRFFDVDTLAAVRVEDPNVFAATHALLLELFHAGHIDGFRIDHPDGLADPRGYFRRLDEATGGAWTVAEKILAPDESLPSDWPTCGTTGYDSAWRLGSLHVDPAGAMPLIQLHFELAGSTAGLETEVETAKRQLATTSLYAEVHRVATLAADICHDDIRLRDHTFRSLTTCLTELVVELDRYRAYVVPGEAAPPESEAVILHAADHVRSRIDPDLSDTLGVVVDLVLGREVGSAGRLHEARRRELIVRFQQVCGAVMAKGVEDTAFYRWTALQSLTEVGGAPEVFGTTPDDVHGFLRARQSAWPATMNAGSTHDSKRSADVRAKIGLISEYTDEWRDLLAQLAPLTERLPGRARNLLCQTLVGTWQDGPISAERLTRYLIKASREQKLWTSWTKPSEEGEALLAAAAERVLSSDAALALLDQWAVFTAPSVRAAVLGTTVTQLTAPGVADIYQGTETLQSFLVDPDNRAPLDLEALAALTEALGRRAPRTLAEEKLLLTRTVLHLRRELPGVFVGADADYRPLAATTGHVLAFARGAIPQAVTVSTRLVRRLAERGGFADHTVVLPQGAWRNLLTAKDFDGGSQRVVDVLGPWPVAVLRRSV